MQIDVSFIFHLALAFALFLLVNLIGKHSASFGYRSVTLFEDVEDSLAFNFIIRVLPPSILIVFVSALLVHFKWEQYRFGIFWIAILYYAIRVVNYFAFGKWRLVNWLRFTIHSIIGISCALIVYNQLVLPKRSLMPDLETAGNEIWFAIALFIYATANQIHLENPSNARRKNRYISAKYDILKSTYGDLINDRISDKKLKLAVYAVIIYEDYSRPWILRVIERLMFWKETKSTGIMQVRGQANLTDRESVEQGVAKMSDSWNLQNSVSVSRRVRHVIADFNRDSEYLSNVWDLMEIISKRVDRDFESEFEGINSYEYWSGKSDVKKHSATIQSRRLKLRARQG